MTCPPISLRCTTEHKDNVRGVVIPNTLVRTSGCLGIFGLPFANRLFSSFLIGRQDLLRRFLLLGAFRRPFAPEV